MSAQSVETELAYPTIEDVRIRGNDAWVILDDEWGVSWEIEFEWDSHEDEWRFCRGAVIPEDVADYANRVDMEPPESLIRLAVEVIEERLQEEADEDL